MLKYLGRSFIVAATSIVLLTAFAPRSAQGAETEPELFLIRSSAQTVFNEFHVADLLGFYKEEGLKIEFLGLVEGLNKYQMLGQGLIDVADGHPDQVAKARLAGIKVKAVAPGMVDHPKYPHVRYFAREDGPIKSLDDIVGKKVAIMSYGSCNEGYLKAHLAKKGVEGEAEWVVLATGGQQEQALTQGLIDLTTSHPPYGSLAEQAGGNRQIATSWDIFNSSAAGLSIRAFSEDFIQKHPDKLRAFSRAMYKARKWIDANMEKAVPLVSEALGLDPTKVSAEWDGRWYAETPGFVKEDIELWFEISESLGYWNHGDLKPEDIYTNEFAPEP
ncbi:MAG: ABC transporter substrate-binding protein [Synergistaceae bacterium]|jgi:ABC-type nitrate/sulfonate/bicarbonate transport system substrate-binding protein|nr:ABC transporter substrate-binding protein [Synergistaceae bacterium]